MGVILSKTANPHETVEHTGTLMAMYRTELEKAKWEVPITTQLGLIDHHVGETVHRLNAVTLLIKRVGEGIVAPECSDVKDLVDALAILEQVLVVVILQEMGGKTQGPPFLIDDLQGHIELALAGLVGVKTME